MRVGREPMLAPKPRPPRRERDRKLFEPGVIVAAREDRLLDTWAKNLRAELVEIDAQVLASLQGSLDSDRAAPLLTGRTKPSNAI